MRPQNTRINAKRETWDGVISFSRGKRSSRQRGRLTDVDHDQLNALAEFHRTRGEAQARLNELRGIRFAVVTALETLIADADKEAEAATTQALGAARQTLLGYVAIAQEIEGAAEQHAKGWKAFNKKYLKPAHDLLWEASQLEGADPAPMRTLYDLADKLALEGSFEEARTEVKKIKPLSDEVKKAARKSQEAFAKDLEAMPKFTKARAKLERALRDLETRPGTEAHRNELKLLLDHALSHLHGDVEARRGYADAYRAIKRYEGIVTEAEKAHKNFRKATLPPALDQLSKAAENSLRAFADVGAPEVRRFYETELARLAVQGKLANDPQAVQNVSARLTELDREIQQAVVDQDRLEKECTLLVGDVRALMNQLNDIAPEGETSRAEVDLKSIESLCRERDYAQASAQLLELKTELQEYVDQFAQSGREWGEESAKIAGLIQQCAALQSWGPAGNFVVDTETGPKEVTGSIGARAIALREELQGLKAEIEKTRDFRDGVNRLAELETQVSAMKAQAGDESIADFERYGRARQAADKAVTEVRGRVVGLLLKVEEKMQGLTDRTLSPLHIKFREVDVNWEVALKEGGETVANAEASLDQAKTVTLEALHKLEDAIERVLGEDRLFQQVLTRAVTENEAKEDEARDQKVADLLDQLKSLGGDDRQARQHYTTLMKHDAETRKPVTKKLETALLHALERRQEALDQKRAPVRQQKAELLEAITTLEKATPGKDNDFSDFFKRMTEEANDLEALICSGDEQLIAQAQNELAALRTRLKTFDPDDPSYAGKGFADVIAKWKQLSGLLGDTNIKAHFGKSEHRRLHMELQQAIVEARSLPPDQALTRINLMETPIKKLQSRAEGVATRMEAFAEKVEDLKARHKELCALTSTSVLRRASQYADRLEARLEKASTIGTAGDVVTAERILDEMSEEMEAIFGAPSPRQALQDADARIGAVLKAIKQMYTSFKKAVETFTKVEIPRLEKAIAKVKNADTSELAMIKKIPKRAAKLVKMYETVVGTFSGPKDPVLSEAKSAFDAAHDVLREGRKSIQRLLANPVGAKVKARKDLAQLSRVWIECSTRFATAVGELAGQIKTDCEANDVAEDHKAAGKKVATRLEALKLVFQPRAFIDSLKELDNEKSTEVSRKAAREQILRVVRQYHKRILEDPLLVAINDRKNPWRLMNGEISALNTTLKNMEVTALVCV